MTDLTLSVQRPANGGAAVGHADDGRVVFVRGAIPGETVTATVLEEKPGFLTAEVDEILEASEHRRAPQCAAAAHGAGCCDLAFIDVDYARSMKSEILTDVLTRIGGFTTERLAALDGGMPVVEALDDTSTGWRVRTRLAVDADGRAGLHQRQGGGIVVGYRCAQPDPVCSDLGSRDGGFTAGADLAIVVDSNGRRHITEIAPAEKISGRRDARRYAQRRRSRREGPRAQRVIEGQATAAHRIGDRIWQIPVTGFWQAHRAAPAAYARTIGEFVATYATSAGTQALSGAGRGVCWDLYGGAGVFAATLIDALGSHEVHIVDSDAGALRAAEQTFIDDAGVHIHRGEVAQVIGGLPAPLVVVLDPPRTGAGARVIERVAASAPEVVIHVGCDAARFARDLRLLAEQGFQTRAIRGFDAFPLTHHIEAIAVLVRATSRP